MTSKPTEQELADRVAKQLAWSSDKATVIHVWQGYLAGLYEWGQIDLDVYSRLSSALPKGADKEIAELFMGQPLSAEQEAQLAARLG